jgi:starch synthase
VFATPELGRWSTVGGLGVMVDELSIGLAKLGQNVTVISPYYERNRKGQTGYLAQDPAGIRFASNLELNINN